MSFISTPIASSPASSAYSRLTAESKAKSELTDASRFITSTPIDSLLKITASAEFRTPTAELAKRFLGGDLNCLSPLCEHVLFMHDAEKRIGIPTPDEADAYSQAEQDYKHMKEKGVADRPEALPALFIFGLANFTSFGVRVRVDHELKGCRYFNNIISIAEANPNNTSAQQIKAYALTMLGWLDLSVSYLKTVVTGKFEIIPALEILGRIYKKRSSTRTLALEYLEKAVAGGSRLALLELLQLHGELGNAVECAQYCWTAYHLGLYNAFSYQQLYYKVSEKVKNHLLRHLHLTCLLGNQQSKAKALAEFEQIITAKQNKVSLQYLQQTANEQLGSPFSSQLNNDATLDWVITIMIKLHKYQTTARIKLTH